MSRFEDLQLKWRDLMNRMTHAKIVGNKEEYYRLDGEINRLELDIQNELPGRKQKSETVHTV